MDEGRSRTRVALIFGGHSCEHGVSCLTAASVLGAIDRERHDVLCLGITESGRWTVVPPDTVVALRPADGRLPTVPEDGPEAVWMHAESGAVIGVLDDETLAASHPIDVAFALLHGPFGEDGTIQGLFEMYGLPYVGCGVAASALGMDKALMKQTLIAHGLPVGPYVVIEAHEWEADQAGCLANISGLTFPVYVKPARGGSSIGISKVDDADGLVAAVEGARKHDPKVLVEQGFVDAREIECAVLESPDHRRPRTSALGEISMTQDGGFYDFEAKYLPEEQVRLDVPALNLSDDLREAVQDVAAATFVAMGAEGLGRVDTFVTRTGEVVVNEINTMPGFTRLSMFPTLWAQSGLPYAELIDELIELALARPVGLR